MFQPACLRRLAPAACLQQLSTCAQPVGPHSQPHPTPIRPPPLPRQAEWDAVSSAALQLFAFGQEQAARRGLLLVDTKYEFGVDDQGG